ncbi:P-II family nitrogen regulator [Clostridiales bacterium COT073_COT-073]|nr:P-II family nitrogen regulator [Clostridiales bacterium COT073_COT-073]
MMNGNEGAAFELIYAVVSYGMGSKLMQKAKKYGIRGGTILPGRGTVQNRILNFFSLYDERKEIVMLGTDRKTAQSALAKLNQDFRFEKPNKGIVFTTLMCEIIGSSHQQREETIEEGENKMYQLITTIVNRGKAEDVIDAAKAAGSKGGTIINARGSGVHETMKLFNMDIEPEKEMVLVLSKADVTDKIIASIREKLEIDKPGNGVIFLQNVHQAYGIYE